MFEVGQRVWDVRYGWGSITSVSNGSAYPIVVRYDHNNLTSTYTLEGKGHVDHANRGLFFEEIPIPESALKPKRWRAKYEECYFFINSHGAIIKTHEIGAESDNKRFDFGNYFKTEKEAMKSKFYKIFEIEEI